MKEKKTHKVFNAKSYLILVFFRLSGEFNPNKANSTENHIEFVVINTIDYHPMDQ